MSYIAVYGTYFVDTGLSATIEASCRPKSTHQEGLATVLRALSDDACSVTRNGFFPPGTPIALLELLGYETDFTDDARKFLILMRKTYGGKMSMLDDGCTGFLDFQLGDGYGESIDSLSSMLHGIPVMEMVEEGGLVKPETPRIYVATSDCGSLMESRRSIPGNGIAYHAPAASRVR